MGELSLPLSKRVEAIWSCRDCQGDIKQETNDASGLLTHPGSFWSLEMYTNCQMNNFPLEEFMGWMHFRLHKSKPGPGSDKLKNNSPLGKALWRWPCEKPCPSGWFGNTVYTLEYVRTLLVSFILKHSRECFLPFCAHPSSSLCLKVQPFSQFPSTTAFPESPRAPLLNNQT